MGFVFNAGTSSSSTIATGSTTSRANADRFAERKNILDFGAIQGDSSANAAANTLAIQAAVYAAWAEGGGRVFIPPGIFWVGSSTNTAVNPGAISLGIYMGVNAVGHPYTWWDDFTFSIKHVVTTATGLFKSVQNSNLNHNPETDATDTWWTPVTGPNVPIGTVSLVIEGVGINSHLKGNFDGFILDRCDHNGAPAHIVIKSLSLTNLSTGAGAGCIRLMGVDGAEVANCAIQGHIGVQIAGNFYAVVLPDNTASASPEPTSSTSFISTVHNCTMNGLTGDVPEAGSVGVAMGMHTEVYQCSIVRFAHAIRGYGVGSAIRSCRLERNITAIFLGMDAMGQTGTATGYHIGGIAFETNYDALYIWDAHKCVFTGLTITDGSPTPPDRSALRFYGGAHNTFIGCSFQHPAGSDKGAVWIEGNLGGTNTFIGCTCGSFYVESGISTQYRHLWRFINCDGAFPGGSAGQTLTYAQLPDNSTFIPKAGDLYVCYPAQKSGGGTAVAGDTIAAGGSQAVLTTWDGVSVWKAVCILG